MIDFSDLLKIEYHGELVLTSKQLSNFCNCALTNIRHNFADNKEQFVKGIHYFYLEGEELKDFKRYVAKLQAQLSGANLFPPAENSAGKSATPAEIPFTKLASSLYLWTKQGAARHCKLVGTKKAWEVFTALETNYFGAKTSESQKCIYALEMSDGTIKIGVSGNLQRRILQIQSETKLLVNRFYNTDFAPVDLALQIEKACHEKFAPACVNGEFFNITFEMACDELDSYADEISAFFIEEEFDAPPIVSDFMSRREQYDELKFLICNCTNDNLRDELIAFAFELFKNPNQ